jgi:hypothetical protein
MLTAPMIVCRIVLVSGVEALKMMNVANAVVIIQIWMTVVYVLVLILMILVVAVLSLDHLAVMMSAVQL